MRRVSVSDGRVAVINPRQYYALIKAVGTNGLVNRDVQGTALQVGQGMVEIAGIQIYKSMNIPFLGKFGTNSSMIHAGDFVGETMLADTAVSGDTTAPVTTTVVRCSVTLVV